MRGLYRENSLLLLFLSVICTASVQAQITWEKIAGPLQGRAHPGQINTKLYVDRKWRIGVAGTRDAMDPSPAEFITCPDSLYYSANRWASTITNDRSDSISAACIYKPPYSRHGNQEESILIGSFYPNCVMNGTIYGAFHTLPVVSSYDLTDITAETDSSWLCTSLNAIFRRSEPSSAVVGWVRVFIAPRGTRFRTITCPGLGSTIYAAGMYGAVYKSTNNGRNFQTASLGIPVTADIVEISFPRVDTGYAATTDGVYRTTDGAQTWQRLSGTGRAKEVSFHDGRYGFYLSDTGAFPVYATADAGQTWQRQTLRTKPTLKIKSLSVTREGHCYVLATRPTLQTQHQNDSLYFYRNPYPSLLTTGTVPLETVSKIILSPNPAHDLLRINGIDARTTWQIVSMLGQPLETGTGPATVQLSKIPVGVYLFFALLPDGHRVHRHLMVE